MTKQRANTPLTTAQTDAIKRFIDMTLEEEIAADMGKAQSELARRGLLRDLGDGEFEITEHGERVVMELIAKPDTRH